MNLTPLLIYFIYLLLIYLLSRSLAHARMKIVSCHYNLVILYISIHVISKCFVFHGAQHICDFHIVLKFSINIKRLLCFRSSPLFLTSIINFNQ